MTELADCDLICEAIVENPSAKKAVFKELDSICKQEAIFASNTSSLSIGDMATATRRRDRFVGLAFLQPGAGDETVRSGQDD